MPPPLPCSTTSRTVRGLRFHCTAHLPWPHPGTPAVPTSFVASAPPAAPVHCREMPVSPTTSNQMMPSEITLPLAHGLVCCARARVCRVAGAVTMHVLVCDLCSPGRETHRSHRERLPLWGGVQLAVDTMLVWHLPAVGMPCRDGGRTVRLCCAGLRSYLCRQHPPACFPFPFPATVTETYRSSATSSLTLRCSPLCQPHGHEHWDILGPRSTRT